MSSLSKKVLTWSSPWRKYKYTHTHIFFLHDLWGPSVHSPTLGGVSSASSTNLESCLFFLQHAQFPANMDLTVICGYSYRHRSSISLQFQHLYLQNVSHEEIIRWREYFSGALCPSLSLSNLNPKPGFNLQKALWSCEDQPRMSSQCWYKVKMCPH